MHLFYKIFLPLLMLSTAATAENLQFESIQLNELAKVGYTQILENDLVVDEFFNADIRQLSIFIKNRSRVEIKKILDNMIVSAGYELLEKGNLIKIAKPTTTKNPDLTPFFYKPKYREVGYLTDMVANLFDVGSFTFNRGLKNPTAKSSDTVDTGTSAFSQLQKPQDAFLFNGTKSEIEKLSLLMDTLDTPQKEVNVKAYIYEVSNTEGKAQSLNLTVDLLNKKLGANLASDVLSSFVSIKTFGITAIFSALSTDSRFKVISSPSLRVKDRETAKFSVGADVPVLGAVITQNGTSTQSVDYKQSGVIVEVSPKIRENIIELTIKQELSNFIQTNTGVNNSPTLIKRGLSTVVTAENDEVIILGGLDELKTTSGSSGFPLLPALFRNKSLDSSKSNILLVLHVQKI